MKYSMRHFGMALIALLATVNVAAQDAGAQKALQKAQFMLRQATAEKTELQTQVADLKQQLDKLTRELNATKLTAVDTQQRAEQKHTNALAQWKQRDNEVGEELRAVKEQLKQQLAQGQASAAQLKEAMASGAACQANNLKLYDINRQLLARYADKGLVDVLKQREPFTGVAQVEIENLVQDYGSQLDELKIQEKTPQDN